MTIRRYVLLPDLAAPEELEKPLGVFSAVLLGRRRSPGRSVARSPASPIALIVFGSALLVSFILGLTLGQLL